MPPAAVRFAALFLGTVASAATAQFNPRIIVRPPPNPGQPATAPAPVVTEPPMEPSAIPTTAAEPTTAPYSPNSAYAQPQTNEKQIVDLQAAVAELQAEVERLRGQIHEIRPNQNDYVLTSASPVPGHRCDYSGMVSLNTILSHVHTHGVAIGGTENMNMYVPGRDFKNDPMVFTWTNCR